MTRIRTSCRCERPHSFSGNGLVFASSSPPARGPAARGWSRCHNAGTCVVLTVMRIAIVGGTGTLGRHVATNLAQRGHEVRVLSRSSPDFPVDLVSGEGLDAALAGCAAVVDAS